MSKFYSKCGELIKHVITLIPNGVSNDVHVTFYYTNGRAEYDGRAWTFKLFDGAEELLEIQEG
jgi:hypothetical protein